MKPTLHGYVKAKCDICKKYKKCNCFILEEKRCRVCDECTQKYES